MQGPSFLDEPALRKPRPNSSRRNRTMRATDGAWRHACPIPPTVAVRNLVCIANRFWPGYPALRIASGAMTGPRGSERWAQRT
jgi:hypothetical protein